MLEVIPVLPDPGNEAGYGKATSGAARAFLTKFYLNTKQWQKAADMAQSFKYWSDPNANSKHLLFPLPQMTMEANPELLQNEGY